MNRHERHADSDSKHATADFTIPFGLDMTGLMYQPAFAAMADVNSRLYAGLFDLNKEWADFVNRRLRDDFTLPQRFGTCKTPQDVFKVYSDFYRQAFGDYQAEFTKLTKMGQDLAAETAEAMQVPHKGSK
jgi:hypothetical protein